MLLVDASIPGDVDTAVERLDGAFLYNLDDLESVAMRGRASRETEARAALDIIDDEVARFLRGRAARAAVPTLTALRRHFETAREAAIADAAGDAEKATRLLINRLLHGPSEALREIAALGSEGATDLRGAERALNRLFRLGDSAPEDEK
jgi:glutamyl-tRNA reductase